MPIRAVADTWLTVFRVPDARRTNLHIRFVSALNPPFPTAQTCKLLSPQTGHVAPPQGPWDMPPGPPLLLKALPGFAPWDQSVPTPLDRRAISRRQKEKRPHGQLSASPPSCKCDLCFIFTQKYKLGCPLIASRVMEAASHGNQSMPGQPSPLIPFH